MLVNSIPLVGCHDAIEGEYAKPVTHMLVGCLGALDRENGHDLNVMIRTGVA